MMAENVLTAEKITELAKKRFQEERSIDHLEGWFLAKEIMRRCDSEFREDPDSIRIASSTEEDAGSLLSFHCRVFFF